MSINKKLDIILENQKEILKNEKKILGKEGTIENLEKKELKEEVRLEKHEDEALKELSALQNEIRRSISSPIKKVTKKDLVKGFVGAFVGVMSHFAFAKGAEIATSLGFLRATVLYIVAFMILIIMLYYSGFKAVQKNLVMKFMPLRALILFSVSIFTIIFVNLLFGKIHLPVSFREVYVIVGASIILACMGAGTADLIGRGE